MLKHSHERNQRNQYHHCNQRNQRNQCILEKTAQRDSWLVSLRTSIDYTDYGDISMLLSILHILPL